MLNAVQLLNGAILKGCRGRVEVIVGNITGVVEQEPWQSPRSGFGQPERSSSSSPSPFWPYSCGSESMTAAVQRGHRSDGLKPFKILPACAAWCKCLVGWAFSRPHHALQGLVVLLGVVAIPGGDVP